MQTPKASKVRSKVNRGMERSFICMTYRKIRTNLKECALLLSTPKLSPMPNAIMVRLAELASGRVRSRGSSSGIVEGISLIAWVFGDLGFLVQWLRACSSTADCREMKVSKQTAKCSSSFWNKPRPVSGRVLAPLWR